MKASSCFLTILVTANLGLTVVLLGLYLSLRVAVVQSQASVTEVTVTFDSPYCQTGCTTLAEWDELVVDEPKLRQSLAVAYHHLPNQRSHFQTLVRNRTRITAEPLPDLTIGQYQSRRNVIILATELMDEPLQVIAPTLLHEAIHGSHDDNWFRGDILGWLRARRGQSVANCLIEEMQAFNHEAAAWATLRQGNESSWGAQNLDWLLEQHSEQKMQERVLLSPHYQQQCLATKLPDY